MAYKVELDIYCGPLDLLLYLIEKEGEVDIYDIPIARIVERYIEHLELVKHIDINLAAEFLVMASRLMEMKSRKLLPPEDRGPEEEDQEDPWAQLVREIVSYRAFKEAAICLGQYQEARARRYGRGGPLRLPEKPKAGPELEDLKNVTLFDLADGYAELIKATGGSRTATILYDEISIAARIDAVIAALKARDDIALRALLSDVASKIEVVGTFFALLELVKERKVRVYQDSEFGEIIVSRRERDVDADGPEPTGPFVEPHLPAPREAIESADGKRKFTGPRRSRFVGLDLPEDRLEAEAPEGADDSAEGGDFDESQEADERERGLNSRIDDILSRADEISARFEQSRAGRHRQEAAAASEGLDEAVAALEADLDLQADEDETPAAGPAGETAQEDAGEGQKESPGDEASADLPATGSPDPNDSDPPPPDGSPGDGDDQDLRSD